MHGNVGSAYNLNTCHDTKVCMFSLVGVSKCTVYPQTISNKGNSVYY